jgi:signal transduction histidine kinase
VISGAAAHAVQLDGAWIARMLAASEPPEAIAAANDGFAVAMMSTLAASGVRVPEDLTVVGFDDSVNISGDDLGFDDGAPRRTPDPGVDTMSLTTVRAPFQELARRAVEVALAMARGQSVPEFTSVPTELVVRRSCGCLPAESTTEGNWRYQRVVIEKRSQVVRDVGQQLITAPDLAALLDMIPAELSKVGIPGCYLALSESVTPPLDRLRRSSPSNIVATPLYFKDQQLGHILFEVGPRIGWIYPALQEQLSCALQHVLIVERERAASAALEEAHRREERQRIASDLHDSVSQALFSMTLHTRALQLVVEQQGGDPGGGDSRDQVARGLAELRDLTQGALSEMRALIFQLRPDALHEDGLVVAVHRHAAAVAAREGIEIDVVASVNPLPLDERAEIELFRVVQEALHNSVKHSHPTRVEIRLNESADAAGTLVVEIADDGVGFDPDLASSGHLGLRTMRERIERLDGCFSIDTSPMASTTVRAVLPDLLTR